MKAFYRAAVLSIPMIAVASMAHAAGSGLPWEAPIDSVTASITGPVLKGALTCLIVGSGIAMANSSSAGVQKFAQLIFGASIAGAFAFFLGFFNVGAGALI